MNANPTVLDFVSLQVTDRAAAHHFYHEILGFALSDYQPPQAEVYQDGKGAIFAVRDPFPGFSSTEKGAGVSLWFGWNGSVDELAKRLEVAGVRIVQPPFDTPFGRALNCLDPEGYSITLHEVSHE